MWFRAVSALMALLFGWAASVQLNDPDPARWIAMYLSAAAVAGCCAFGLRLPRVALAVGLVALVWAAAIVPELVGRWSPQDLAATMSAARPEVEFGRELGGLSILATYCLLAARQVLRAARPALVGAPAQRDAVR